MFRWKKTGNTEYTLWERRCSRQSTASPGVCSGLWSSPRGGTWWSPPPPPLTNWDRSCSDCTPEVAQERGRSPKSMQIYRNVGHWSVAIEKVIHLNLSGCSIYFDKRYIFIIYCFNVFCNVWMIFKKWNQF